MSIKVLFDTNVLLDVVLCGVPGGGDVPGDPVDQCYAGGGQ